MPGVSVVHGRLGMTAGPHPLARRVRVGVGLLAGLCVLVFGAAPAGAATSYGDVCSLLGPPGFCTTGTFGFPAGVAVDNSANPSTKGDVYIETEAAKPVIESQSASEEKPSSAKVSATINPSGANTTCRVQYGPTVAYGSEAPCPAGLGEGTAGVPVSAELAGLQPRETYHYQFVATNTVGTVEGHEKEDATFTTTSPPVVDSTSAVTVYSTSADLEAEINPEGFDTHYHFEYISDSDYAGNGNSFSGPNPATSAPAAEVDLGAGNIDQIAKAHLQSLAPSTLYHYRAVATSELGTTDGPVTTLTTPESAPSDVLPDDRVYEMVSPVDKNGGEAGDILNEGHNDLDFSRSSVETPGGGGFGESI